MTTPTTLPQPESSPGHIEALALYEQYRDPANGKKLRDAVRAQVVQWRWSTESVVDDQPFENEQRPACIKRKPRWLKEGKEKKSEHVKCGFDASGRIVYEIAYVNHQSVWLHAQGKIVKVHFMVDSDDRSAGLQVWGVVVSMLLPDGRLASLHSRNTMHNGCCDEFFSWESTRLIAKHSVGHDGDETVVSYKLRYRYDYDAAGELEKISSCEIDADGTPLDKPRTRYRRPVKGDTIPLLAAAIQEAMLKKIPELVKQAALDEPLYALLLCYTEEDFATAWPPFLVWGRQSWRNQTTEERGYMLWAPDEIRGNSSAHELWLDCDDEIAGLCLRHKDLMSDKDSYTSGKKVLLEVAKQLNALDWKAITAVTDDFVVVVADNSCEIDPLKDMKKYLPPERLALLKTRGWLDG